MNISIERPMNNLTIVQIGEYEFAFSYETVVAFRDPLIGWQKSENVWSQTTGRHLNYLPGKRTPRANFEVRLAAVLESFGTVGSEEHEPSDPKLNRLIDDLRP